MKIESRALFREIVRSFVVCNTPKSLFKSIRKTSSFQTVFEDYSLAEIKAKYNTITARHVFTPLTFALAYTLLIAACSRYEDCGGLDPTLLPWGKEMSEFAAQDRDNTSILILPSQTPQPRLQLSYSDRPFIMDSKGTTTPKIIV
ncbi:MAG: hypothetical protein CFE26_02570 [Verrucomicrobiales bacterium VVV1]|nr:MAG: hypothetical protein CFE26_02570 [Verrucomicrobiales bacterium VVV1]